MLKAISWGQYVGAVFVLLLLYYAYVAAVYYRAELLGLVKGKAAPGAAAAPAPALPSLIGKGPLIARPAVTLPVPPPEAAAPTPAPDQEAGGEAAPGEEESLADQPTDGGTDAIDLPALDLPSVELGGNLNYENHTEISFVNDNSIKFTEQGGSNTFQDTEGGMESAPAAFEPGFTIGIAQLGDYLKRATDGQLTPEQIVEQAPGLENTDLMVAFFQASTKSVQRAATQRYTGIAEPALD